MGVGRGGHHGSKWAKGGAGLAPALSLTGSGQCPAAEGRGPAYAHKLISSASAGPPAQSACLHCEPQAFSCWVGWGGGVVRLEGGGVWEAYEPERREAGASMQKRPLRRPAKSLSYMENTSCLQGNGTTSEFLRTKIALMSGCDLAVLWPSSLSACPSHFKFPHHVKTLFFHAPTPTPNSNKRREGLHLLVWK